MSRAFVNEDNAAAQADQPVERQVSTQPNYVTPQGLAQLQAKVTELQARHAEQTAKGEQADKQRLADLQRDLRYFTQRLSSAQVAVAATSTDKVQIGSWVTYADEHDTEHGQADHECFREQGRDSTGGRGERRADHARTELSRDDKASEYHGDEHTEADRRRRGHHQGRLAEEGLP